MISIEKIFTYYDFLECKKQVETKQPFSLIKKDHKNYIELSVSMHFCDNGLWNDNLYVAVDGRMENQGFGYPMQKNEFLELSFEKLIDIFSNGLDIKQTQMQISLL